MPMALARSITLAPTTSQIPAISLIKLILTARKALAAYLVSSAVSMPVLTMGVSRSLRLVLPKVAALSLVVPLLVVWCSAAGIVGGMVSANLEMGLAYGYFIDALPRVVPLSNLWIGLGKGWVFGFVIALIACHFGLKVRPNTESLSQRTTTSVVSAITLVIIVDAIIAACTGDKVLFQKPAAVRAKPRRAPVDGRQAGSREGKSG